MRPVVLLLAAASVSAAQVSPHAGFVYPAGGRQGTSFEVIVGGQFLNGAAKAYVSGDGVKPTVLKHTRPLTGAEATQLREQMQQLAAKAGRTPEEDKTLAGIRERLADFVRRPSPAISESVLLRVEIAADAAPGDRELRLGAANGLTNPLLFRVGQLAEFSRKPAKVPAAFSVANGATPPNRQPRPPEPPTDITFPIVVNGQMMPGATDRYRFQAAKGQQLVIDTSARELVPYLSDAVPGWFQATVVLRDPSGAEAGYAGSYRFHPDPVLHYEVPADGEYTLEIHDSIYRGREDFVYRISIGELPFVTGLFPIGGREGARTKTAIAGWNLPASAMVVDAKHKPPAPFDVDTLPEVLSKGAERREKAQRVKLPVMVNGRITRPGDSQFFRFGARAGEEIVAEVKARRLGSPLDSVLKLMDASGKVLASNDDFEDKGAGLITHQADSRILFRTLAKGTYYLQLADAQHQGGPEYAYRLRISRPRPDFELLISPSSVNVRAGGTVPITVYALRHDGFAGAISLSVVNLAPGFRLSGGEIPASADSLRMTLTAPPGKADAPIAAKLEGRADIGGRQVSRTAIPAEDMMQAFAYHHLVAQHEWMVQVVGTGAPRILANVPAGQRLGLPMGGTAPIEVMLPPRLAGQVHLELDEPPDGVSIQSVSPTKNGVRLMLGVEGAKVQQGLKGNLIVEAYADRPNGAARRQPIGTLPAIPFEIVNAPQRR